MTKTTRSREELLETLSAAMDDNCHDRQELSDLFDRLQQSSPAAAELKEKFESYHVIRDAMHNDLSAVCTPDFSARVSAAIANEPPIVSAAAGGRNQHRSVDAIAKVPVSRPVETHSAVDIQQPVEQSPVELGDYRKEKSHSRKTAGSMFGAGIGGMAVAASAALIALVGFNVLDHSGSNNNPATLASTSNGVEVVATTNSDSDDAATPVVTNQIAAVGSSNETASGSTAGRTLVNSLQVAPVEFVSNPTTFWAHEQSSPANPVTRNPANEKRLNQLLTRHLENSPTARIGGLLPYARIAGYDTEPASDDSQEKVEENQ